MVLIVFMVSDYDGWTDGACAIARFCFQLVNVDISFLFKHLLGLVMQFGGLVTLNSNHLS